MLPCVHLCMSPIILIALITLSSMYLRCMPASCLLHTAPCERLLVGCCFNSHREDVAVLPLIMSTFAAALFALLAPESINARRMAQCCTHTACGWPLAAWWT